jgi:hypothetical protein
VFPLPLHPESWESISDAISHSWLSVQSWLATKQLEQGIFGMRTTFCAGYDLSEDDWIIAQFSADLKTEQTSTSISDRHAARTCDEVTPRGMPA